MTKYFWILFVMLFLGCKNEGEDIFMKPLNGNWSKKDLVSYTFNVKDTQTSKNIIFVVRNNSDYPYSNLWLIASFKDEKAKQTKVDSLNYILAEPNGKWLGSGFGRTKEIAFQYKLNYTFPHEGKYTVSVRQAMRKDNLPGIEDFGIKIENVKP